MKTTPTDQLDLKRDEWEKISPFVNHAFETIGVKLAATKSEKKLNESEALSLLAEEGEDLCNTFFHSIFLDLLNPNTVTSAKKVVSEMRGNSLMESPDEVKKYLKVLLDSFIESVPSYLANLDAFEKVAAAKPSKEGENSSTKSKVCDSYVITTINEEGEEEHLLWSGQGRRSSVLQKILKDPIWVTHNNPKRYISDHDEVTGKFPDGTEWKIATSDAFSASHDSAVPRQ